MGGFLGKFFNDRWGSILKWEDFWENFFEV
jgi:hypothetical protein